MKAVVLRGRGSVGLEERPDAVISAPTDALVRVSLTAISAADRAAYTAGAPAGVVLGREILGVVEAVGAAVSHVAVGQRVIAPAAVHCGGCFYCKQGLLSACEHLQVFGRDLPGTQASLMRIPNADALLEALPDGVGDVAAVLLADLLPGVFSGLEAAGVHAGSSVLVLGCGPTGLAAQLLASTMGAGLVYGVDRHADRLAQATALGATALDAADDIAARLRTATDGRGADVVVEATGTLAALAQGAGLVRAWGTLLSLGTGPADDGAFPAAVLAAKGARLLSYGSPATKNAMAALSKMVARGVLDPSPLVSHTFLLADAAAAYELAGQRDAGAFKVLLRP